MATPAPDRQETTRATLWGALVAGLVVTGILFKAAHPPAGATTLIISLGAIARPLHLVIIEVALVLLVLQAIAINRLAGLDYLLWRPRAR